MSERSLTFCYFTCPICKEPIGLHIANEILEREVGTLVTCYSCHLTAFQYFTARGTNGHAPKWKGDGKS
jgi:hypothetical protein